MDSLTQIVLGAAVGEVVLGKKIGNKAMLWGAIAGTIPDLDVYQSLIFDSLRANELHRGFLHSILFSVVFAPLLAWLVLKTEKWTLASLITIILAFPFITISDATTRVVLASVLLIILFFVFRNDYGKRTASVMDWRKLMFWSLVTHPLLDCHTTWGTELLWPLPYKLAWNNIFVIDPLYTVPFLLFVILAMFFNRQSKTRMWLNWTGIIVSSMYMVWSLGVKWYTYDIFEKNLQDKGIAYSRLTTVPTPANTFLWSATADSDSVYYTGLYSIFDSDKNVEFFRIDHNHRAVADIMNDNVIKRLNFLSKDWYVINEDSAGIRTYNDARFGPMYTKEGVPEYGFGYQLINEDGNWVAEEEEPPTEDMGELLKTLWNRIWGK
ncbi:MAG: metal-dependent hydrolase [Bacteroidetes bacterium]|nr:MAG: metal-dependent hydrolase [Bacteroidota bacterium]